MIDRVRVSLRQAGRLCIVALACGMVCWSTAAGADEPPSSPPLTEAQQERLKQRDAIAKRVDELIQAGQRRTAIGEVEKMLAMEREILGNEHEDVIGSLKGLRDLNRQCEDFAAAKKFGEEILALEVKRFGPADWRVTDARLEMEDVGLFERLSSTNRLRLNEAITKFNDATALSTAGKNVEAIEQTLAAAATYRELLGNAHPGYATILDSLNTLYRLQGDLTLAESPCREAISIRKQVLGEHHPSYADSLYGLALLHEAKHEANRAEPLYRQAFEILKSTAGESHPDCLVFLERLAVLQATHEDYSKTIAIHEEVRGLLKRTLGEETLRYAAAVNELALAHDTHGDYVRAEPLYREALRIAKQVQGDHRADSATYLHNLARLLCSQGDFPKAEPLYHEALAAIKQVHGTQDARYAVCLSNLSILHFQQDEFAKAEPLCREALEIRKQLFNDESAECAASQNVLAAILEAQKNYTEAETLFRQVIAIVTRTDGEKHPEFPSYLNNLAMNLQAQGKHREAEALFRQALAMWKRNLGDQHPSVALGLTNLSLSLLCLGQTDEALQLSRQAAEVQRNNVETVVAIQSERQQFLSAKSNRGALDALVTVLSARGKPATDEYNEVLQAKGRVWQRQVTARATAHATSTQPEVAKLVNELRSLSARRATLTLAPPDAQGLDKWQNQLAEVVELQEARERTLFEKSAAIRAARQPVTTNDIRSHLPEGTVLIDFLEYSQTRCRHGTLPRVTSERRLAAFIIRYDVPDIAIVDLGAIDPLSEAIDTWRRLFTELPAAQRPDSPAAQQAGKLLRQKIWDPLEPHVTGCKLVVISPDGVLGRFPLAALPGKAKDSYLLEDVSLAVVPCVMALPRMLAKNSAEPRREVAGDLLVLGNVDYDSAAEAPAESKPKVFGRRFAAVRGADWKHFGPIEATRGELASIEKLYRDEFGSQGITLLEGRQAREDRFCIEAPRHKFLHIATHGFFAPASLKSMLHDNTEGSRSAASPLGGISPFLGYPPGLLSGLAFAGANQASAADQDDGILTASEVESLDLRGVKLAVLSACETGLGEVAGGEGLLGLQRAFQVAGAQTVVASLWEVPDIATRTLMERFYDNLLRKELGPLDALREAQLWMLREGPQRGLVRLDPPHPANEPRRTPPFDWAAFVLSGDWR